MQSSNCCGLDFGTSNSTIGLGLSTGAELCPVEGTNVTIPSAVFFDFEDNKTLFGRAGIASYMEEIDGRLMRSLKSILGTSTMQEKTRVGNGTMPFTLILGKFVRHLKQCAETHLGSDINSVVLGRPVHFIDYDEKADKIAEETLAQIARDQGFRHVTFQFEPIAAALDYEQYVEREELALIADIGGGTSDFTIVRLSPERALKLDRADDILANEGVHIGGTDFDRRLSLKQIMPLFGYDSPMVKTGHVVPSGYFYDLATWQRINFLYTEKTHRELREVKRECCFPRRLDRLINLLKAHKGHQLVMSVETAKIMLSENRQTILDLDFVEDQLSLELSRQDLEISLDRDLRALQLKISGAMTSAGIRASDITALFMTGGSTAIPCIQECLKSMVPAAKIVKGDAFGSVGIGLTLEANKIFA